MTVIRPALYRELEPVAGQAVKALSLDPITIVIVIQALAAILTVIRECRDLGWLRIRKDSCLPGGRMVMRKAVRRKIGGYDFARIGGEDFLVWVANHAKLYKAAEIDNLLSHLAD